MEEKEDDSSWILALEAALQEDFEIHEVINIIKGRIIPEVYREKVWSLCLGGSNKINNFANFDEIFDLPEQSIIRGDCKSLIDKLGNDEEDKVSVICEVESIITHYCKSRHLTYSSNLGWADILTPLLAAKIPYDQIYVCFEEILEKFVPRDTGKDSAAYHLLRLLILYHDPELSTFLDSKRITPDIVACSWLKTLFASVCNLDVILYLWDVYFQERDAFFALFLCLVILFNAREQIMSMTEVNRSDIIDMLGNIPTALSVNDVFDFCSLARYYSMKTPLTFRKEFSTSVFGSVFMGTGEECKLVGGLPLSQALCLPILPEEVIEASILHHSDADQVRFFLVDCRPSEQYNAGHLPNAFHLDSNLMLQHPASFQTAVKGLFMAQRQAVASGTLGCGDHFCFIGSGREIEDQYVHMVVSSFLQRNTLYVSLAKGGYQAFHHLLISNLDESFTDHDVRNCICCSDSQSTCSGSTAAEEMTPTSAPKIAKDSQVSIFNKFSTAVKSKSADWKGKLVEYVTNPNGESVPDKHVDQRDKHKKLYRDFGDVFSIQDEDDYPSGEASSSLEVIDISQWLQKPGIVSFCCSKVLENGQLIPSHLLLTDSLLFVIQEMKDQKELGRMTVRRTLSSIVRITSKKTDPKRITFTYGSIMSDGSTINTDIDRFLIPDSTEVLALVKEKIRNKVSS